MKRITSLFLTLAMLAAMLSVTADAVQVTDNIIDITDKTVLSGMLTAQVQKITVSGAQVISAVEDGTTIEVVLSGDTSPDAQITAEFTSAVTAYAGPPPRPTVLTSHTGNTCTLSGGTGTMNVTVTVANSAAPNMKGSAVYTINFVTQAPAGPTVRFTSEPEEAEITYIKGHIAEPLSVSAEYTGETESPVTYQWYKNEINSTEDGTVLEDADTADFMPPTDTYGTVYYYAVASCEGLSATSKMVKITVPEPYITFTKQPTGNQYTKGDSTAPLEVLAVQSEGADVEYQWYKNDTNSTAGSVLLEGEASASYTPGADAAGTVYYYATVTSLDKNGGNNLVATSNIAKIDVILPVVSFSGTTGGSALYLVGDENAASFEVSAVQSRGDKVSYQWYKNETDSTVGGIEIEGADTADFTPPTDSAGTYYYYVIASCPDSTPATSRVYTVNVRCAGVEFVTNPTEQVSVNLGDTVTLNVCAEPTVPDAFDSWQEKLSYQWYKNEVNSTEGGKLLEGAVSGSYRFQTSTVGTAYYYAVACMQYGDDVYTATSPVCAVNTTLAPVLIYTNGKDGTNWGDSYAYIDKLYLDGAVVDSYSWQANECTVKLAPDTKTDAELELSFTVSGSFPRWFNAATLNGADIKSAKKGTIKLENGAATAEIYARGWKNGVTKTIRIELSSVVPPVCIKNGDSITAYPGFETIIDAQQYFTGAETYYLIKENGEKDELSDGKYRFTPSAAGSFACTFGASNKNGGDCPDTVTVTAVAHDVENGVWIRNITSNGSLDSVTFTDANGEAIQGLEISLDGTEITVTVPRTFGLGGSIKASFALSQTNGLPFISASDAFNQGKGSTTEYTSVISAGIVTKKLYLYNNIPGATNNSYTTYTIKYILQNNAPTLSEGQTDISDAQISAGEAYTLDLSSVFSDADGDTLTYTVKVNGSTAIQADESYSFTASVGGTYTLEFSANDGIAICESPITVTLFVKNSENTYNMTVILPQDMSPKFYITKGYSEDGTDIPGDELLFYAGAAADGNIPYTVSVPDNISEISVRSEGSCGMATPAAKDSTAVFCKVSTQIKELGARDVPGTVKVTCGTCSATGADGIFLLLCGVEYTFSATPSDSGAYNSASKVLAVSEDNNNVVITVTYKSPKTVITSSGASAKLFKFTTNYYVHTIYEPLATVDNGNGTSTHYFNASGDLSYRVAVDGKITKAGYLSGNSATVLHAENDAAPSTRVDYSLSGTDAAAVADDSLLLNINRHNHLSMSVGDVKVVKAYRAWEIINSHMNHIIQPDFHFSIISGENAVRLEQVENQPMTNSSGNWYTLTATGTGTAVVEVTYDAIYVEGGSYSGLYGATDPARTGLFVVTVGEAAPEVDFGIECRASQGSTTYSRANAKPWDSEFDTLYFIGESGELKLSPTVSDGSIKEVALSCDKGRSYTALENADGIYTATITSGNNIIRVTTDKGVAYKIVRGDSIELSVKNITNPGKPLASGDTVSVRLIGVHTPVPKISGTYNPGYNGNTDGDSKVRISYSFGDSRLQSVGRQYDFSQYGATVELTIPEGSDSSEFVLTDGYISAGIIGVTGFADNGDSHRNIPDSGSGTRDNKTTFITRSILPDITLRTGMLPSGNTAPFIRETAPVTATVRLGGTYAISMSRIFTDRDGDTLTYTAKVGDKNAASTEEYYTFTPDATGIYTIVFTASDAQAQSDCHTLILTVKEKESSSPSPTLKFNISGSKIKGYVNVSFTDNGKRVAGETNVKYPKSLGTIISSKRVPMAEGDTVADVTLRLLDALGYTYEHTGSTKDGFYLSSIGGFTLKGIDYDSFGEFDAGSGSGWMITLNKNFIEYGASEFTVKNGDIIKWQYTCRLGEDIGDPFYQSPSDSVSSVKNDKTEKEQEEADKTCENETADTEKSDFSESTFADIKKDDWHYEYVKYVYEKGLMQGTGAGFEPEGKMTRAMLVTVLHRLEGAPALSADDSSALSHFADVDPSAYYANAVSWAKQNGIVNGITENEFAPDDHITREQMALIIYRYAKMKGLDISAFASLEGFYDTQDISSWALDAIKWAKGAGLVNGTDKTALSPKGSATRAQIAAILMRFCEITANK